MKQPVDTPEFWRAKITSCRGELHRTMFEGSYDRVSRQEMLDRLTLARLLTSTSSVLDCGCGYGRLLYLLPDTWRGEYLGVDISPDFLDMAEVFHPGRRFVLGDLRDLSFLDGLPPFDLAVVSWVRQMVRENLGEDEWCRMEAEIAKHSNSVLYLME